MQNFLFLGSGDLPQRLPLLSRSEISGVQVVYTWKQLEPAESRYDFSAIETDLALTQARGKKLFLQIQDRFFRPQDRNIPPYLLTNPLYGGGLVPQIDNPGEGKPPVAGWATQQWNPPVRHRFQALLGALAARFDGRVYGLNLPETAVDINRKSDRTGFTCDGYFQAELDNLAFARNAWTKSLVVQYVNFWPCEWNNDHRYMERLFAFAASHEIGLGGPDIVPGQRGQMANSYPFFHAYRGRLATVAMAVQEPTLTYRNPQTGKPFSREEFETYARNFLGARILFWTPAAPWLRLEVKVLSRKRL